MPVAKGGTSRPTGEDLFKLIKAQDNNRVWFTIYGPRKVGKTTAALSVSSAFGALDMDVSERIAQVKARDYKPIVLDDIAIIAVDVGATDCAVDLGATIPEDNVLDYTAAVEAGYSASGALPAVINAACGAYDQDKIKWLIIDTITEYDKRMLRENLDRGDSSGGNNFAGYGFQATAHSAVVAACRKWKGNIIFLAHSKSLDDPDTSKKAGEAAKKKIKAQYGQQPDVIVDITGKGGTSYLNNSSLIAVMLDRPVPGKNGQRQRRLFSGNDFGYDGGSRFDSLLLEMASEAESGDKPDQGLDSNLHRIYTKYKERKANG